MAGQLSNNGFQFLKKHESFRTKPYKALKNETHWTVGYGHYGADVNPNKIYTEAECDALFMQDKAYFENQVNKVWREPMSQSMFDALFSIAYNTGSVPEVLRTALANNGWQNVDKIVSLWTKTKVTSKGQFVQGLVNRRKDEVNYFYSGDAGGGLLPNIASSLPAAPNPNQTQSYSSPSLQSSYNYTASVSAPKQSPSQAIEPNNYTTYNSILAGAELNTDTFASNVIDNMDSSNINHTRIYKATNSKIIVDELSLAMTERDIDTSINKENPTA